MNNLITVTIKEKRKEINKLLGTNNGEVIIVQEFFNHGKGHKGVTGSSFVPVSKEEIEKRNDVEYVKDTYDTESMWKEAVANGMTDKSLEDYTQSLIDADVTFGEQYFFAHDDSYVYKFKELLRSVYPDAETFECIGGGRMFPCELDKILDAKLLESVNAWEKS